MQAWLLDTELFTAFSPARSQDCPASSAGHTGTKAMALGALAGIGLVSPFHERSLSAIYHGP